MSSEPYAVKERTMSTSHIRGYARGIGNERTDKLQFAIRQYISSLDLSHQLGDFTSIMFPGFGVAKVLRALFPQPDLSRPPRYAYARSGPSTLHARGASYQLKQDVVGDGSELVDGCRDAWHIINHLQADMPPPIVWPAPYRRLQWDSSLSFSYPTDL